MAFFFASKGTSPCRAGVVMLKPISFLIAPLPLYPYSSINDNYSSLKKRSSWSRVNAKLILVRDWSKRITLRENACFLTPTVTINWLFLFITVRLSWSANWGKLWLNDNFSKGYCKQLLISILILPPFTYSLAIKKKGGSTNNVNVKGNKIRAIGREA